MKDFLFKCVGSFFISLVAIHCCDAASSLSASPELKRVINVGIYAPFSDESAFIGRNILGAMEIARDQLKPAVHYEFYTLDKISNKTKATAILQKFIDTHHINVLISEGADSGVLAAPLANKNNLIHFCLTNKSILVDGKNNFLAQSSNKRSVVLTQSAKSEFIDQFKQEYFSQPVSEAGYAFDVFHLLHHSVSLAMKDRNDFSRKAVARQLLALEPGVGVMGLFTIEKNGILYKKPILSA